MMIADGSTRPHLCAPASTTHSRRIAFIAAKKSPSEPWKFRFSGAGNPEEK